MILFYLVSMYLLCFLCFNSLINKKFSDFKVYYKICKILGFDSEIIEIRFQRSQKHLIGQWCIDVIEKIVGNKAKAWISKWVFQGIKARQFFRKKWTFPNLCVSGGKTCSFFGKFGVLCFLEIPVLRLALLPYYRGNEVIILTKWPLTDKISIEKNVFFSKPLPLI